MIKAKDWDGKDLEGLWLITFKLDGVRAIVQRHIMSASDTRVVSKNGKPLYNLDGVMHTFTDAEIYCGSRKATLGKVRASKRVNPVKESEVYNIVKPIDTRLIHGYIDHPRASAITALLRMAVKRGYEGLVLRRGNTWVKVKRHITYDERVTGTKPGFNKYRGMIGALVTKRGQVGGGLKDHHRRKSPKWWIGKVIEVKCQQLTEAGKFMHARLVRVRWDK